MTGTFFVNSGRISSSYTFKKGRYMTRSEVTSLFDRGFEIGGHTTDHLNLIPLSNNSRISQVCEDFQNLHNMGFNVTNFAFPFGAKNFTDTNDLIILPNENESYADALIKFCGYKSARVSGGIGCGGCPAAIELGKCLRCRVGISLPVSKKETYSIRTSSYRPHLYNLIIQTLESVQNVVEEENDSHRWVPITFHSIGEFPNDPVSIDYSVFKSMCKIFHF